MGGIAAYEVDGMYISIPKKFSEYGKLSGQNLEDLQAGNARINVDGKEKRCYGLCYLEKDKNRVNLHGRVHGYGKTRMAYRMFFAWLTIC